MDTYALVRSEHLNHSGSLFGGQMLLWVDEYAWLTAARDFPENRLVTRAMDDIEFRHPVRNGAILRFHIEVGRIGKTSVCYSVEVFSDQADRGSESLVFQTRIIFTGIDEDGRKAPLKRKD